MKQLSNQQVVELATWINSNRNTNWGTWGNYPTLPATATYLSYDVNPMQINFSTPILIGEEEVNVLTESRRIVGKKYDKVMFIESFLEDYLPGYKDAKSAVYIKQQEADRKNEQLVESTYDLTGFTGGDFPSNNKIKSAINTFIMSINHKPEDRKYLRWILEKKCKLQTL